MRHHVRVYRKPKCRCENSCRCLRYPIWTWHCDDCDSTGYAVNGLWENVMRAAMKHVELTDPIEKPSCATRLRRLVRREETPVCD